MQCDSMAFGAIALAIVGSSWCLTGAILGRAPKDGLDTGMVQLGSSVVSIVAGLILGALLLPPSPVGGKVLAATLGTYALAGSLNFAALQAMAVGMQRGPNGRVWGIMQSAQLFSFLGGVVFFGDPLTPPRIVGIALRDREGRGPRDREGRGPRARKTRGVAFGRRLAVLGVSFPCHLRRPAESCGRPFPL